MSFVCEDKSFFWPHRARKLREHNENSIKTFAGLVKLAAEALLYEY